MERRCDMRDVRIQPSSWDVDDDVDVEEDIDDDIDADDEEKLSFSYARV
jgi:hypothetical protein